MGLVKEEAEEMYEEGSSGALSELSYSEIKCQVRFTFLMFLSHYIVVADIAEVK